MIFIEREIHQYIRYCNNELLITERKLHKFRIMHKFRWVPLVGPFEIQNKQINSRKSHVKEYKNNKKSNVRFFN